MKLMSITESDQSCLRITLNGNMVFSNTVLMYSYAFNRYMYAYFSGHNMEIGHDRAKIQS